MNSSRMPLPIQLDHNLQRYWFTPNTLVHRSPCKTSFEQNLNLALCSQSETVTYNSFNFYHQENKGNTMEYWQHFNMSSLQSHLSQTENVGNFSWQSNLLLSYRKGKLRALVILPPPPPSNTCTLPGKISISSRCIQSPMTLNVLYVPLISSSKRDLWKPPYLAMLLSSNGKNTPK